QQDIAGCLVVEVGVVDLPRQAARVVPRVGDDPSAGRACGALVVAGVRRDLLVVPGGRKLALTFAEETVVEGVGGVVSAVLSERVGGDHRRGVGAVVVLVLDVRRIALGPVLSG